MSLKNSNELDLFIIEEIKDHLEQLYEIVNTSLDDSIEDERAEYHHAKILNFITRLESTIVSGGDSNE